MTDDDLTRLAPLADPVRRALYDLVVARPDPVDRDAAAAAAGIGRPLAAFHLDRLAAAGLLDVEFHRRSGRTGPGAGRPAKFYRRAQDLDVSVSLPPRRYEALADILATGIEESPDARSRSLEAAASRGRDVAASLPPNADLAIFVAALRDRGYEPFADDAGAIRLRNCPFERLSEDHRDVTCSVNLAMLSAVAEGVPTAGVEAQARPADGCCCVAFVPGG